MSEELQNAWTGLDLLRQRYPWPETCPKVEPNGLGWLADETALVLKRAVDHNTKLIVELGAWFGMSTRFLLKHAPNATVISVDHWMGSRNINLRPEFAALVPIAYETFIRNQWKVRDRLVAMKTTSDVGLTEVHEAGLEPDLIYVDADHSTPAVVHDTLLSTHLFPNAKLIGDDWTFESVRKGVRLAGEELKKAVRSTRTAWWLEDLP